MAGAAIKVRPFVIADVQVHSPKKKKLEFIELFYIRPAASVKV